MNQYIIYCQLAVIFSKKLTMYWSTGSITKQSDIAVYSPTAHQALAISLWPTATRCYMATAHCYLLLHSATQPMAQCTVLPGVINKGAATQQPMIHRLYHAQLLSLFLLMASSYSLCGWTSSCWDALSGDQWKDAIHSLDTANLKPLSKTFS